jgi:hypothetical protein
MIWSVYGPVFWIAAIVGYIPHAALILLAAVIDRVAAALASV